MSAESTPTPPARQRLIDAATLLIAEHGVRGAGVDTIAARAGTAKTTLYRCFGSKDALVVAVIEEHRARWTRGTLIARVERSTADPARRLHAIFDVLDTELRSPGFRPSPLVTVLLETSDEPDGAINRAAAAGLDEVRQWVEDLAQAAGASEPAALSRDWLILIEGALVAGASGDRDSALRAGRIAVMLLAAGPRPLVELPRGDAG